MSESSNKNTSPSQPAAILPDHSFSMDVPGTRYGRAFRSCWFVFWGVVCPAIFLAMASDFHGLDMWQSGDFGTYALLVFHASSMWMLYPLLVFSACGLVAMAFNSSVHVKKSWVQLAVLSGTLLWIELWIAWCGGVARELGGVGGVLMITFVVSPFVGMIFVQPFVAIMRLLTLDQYNPKYETPSKFLYVVVLVVFGLASLLLLAFWIICVICAAPLAVSAYAYASYEILASRKSLLRIRLSAIFIAIAWLSVHFAAWRIAIVGAIREYNQLPTEQPQGCFVASAAARGHHRFVKSWRVRGATGHRVAITRQLQLLKSLEILLKESVPRLHKSLRRVYNRVGPVIARRLGNPWLADGVYILLKPAEWLAWVVVRSIGKVPANVVAAIYRA
ncbi:MAG: DUF6688 family protein [Aeoliella sp.]